MEIQWIIIISYLVLGWVFTRWFGRSFLEDGNWSDSEFTPGNAMIVNLCWLPMGTLIAALWMIDNCPSIISSFFSKVYGIK